MYYDFNKVFDKIFFNILISELVSYELHDIKINGYIKLLENYIQRVFINNFLSY